MQLNCWLTPAQEKGLYDLALEFPQQNRRIALGKTDLRLQCQFNLLNKSKTLEYVLDLLDKFNEDTIRQYTDEAGMYDIGVFLYRATLGKHGNGELDQEAVDLRIISPCEHIHRLPWNMLARDSDNRFLRYADWQITLAREYNPQRVEMPSLPALLVFSPPEIDGYNVTGTSAHIRQLQTELTAEIRSYESPTLFKLVHTRQELERILQLQHFDVLYYYGHGEGDDLSSRLRLETTTPANPGTMSLIHLRETLQRAVGGSPAVCYINACMSASGGKMGAGLQLGYACAAVIANRTEAWVSVAQRQGLSFLKYILLDALSPHEALHRTVTSGYEDVGDSSWATPILTRHYTEWQCKRKPNLHHLNRQDKDWPLKLDRVSQSGYIGEYMEAVLNGSIDTLCCVWYGSAAVGVDLLHERVQHKVPGNTDLITCQMNWPMAITDENCNEMFRASLLAGFRCIYHAAPSGIEAIPRFLKEVSLHAGSHRLLFHLRLQTVRPTDKDWAIPTNFKHFLDWWQRVVAPELSKAQIPAIITLGYELVNLKKLEEQYDKHLKPLNTQQLMVRRLPPLEPISQDHMRDFIQTFKLPVPPQILDAKVADIEKKTGGHYQRTLECLINLYEHSVMITPDNVYASADDDFDFA